MSMYIRDANGNFIKIPVVIKEIKAILAQQAQTAILGGDDNA